MHHDNVNISTTTFKLFLIDQRINESHQLADWRSWPEVKGIDQHHISRKTGSFVSPHTSSLLWASMYG